MTTDRWKLEVYRRQGGEKALVSTHEFQSLVPLRIALVQNRGMSFLVRCPAQISAGDIITLLDLRAQGFDILTTPASKSTNA